MPLLANPSLLSAGRLNFSRAKSCPSSMRGRKLRAQRTQEELAPVIEQAIMRKEKVAPLAEDKIPSCVVLGRQVATDRSSRRSRRRRVDACWPPHRFHSKISGGIGCVSLPSVLAAPLRAFASAWTWIGPTN